MTLGSSAGSSSTDYCVDVIFLAEVILERHEAMEVRSFGEQR